MNKQRGFGDESPWKFIEEIVAPELGLGRLSSETLEPGPEGTNYRTEQ